MRYPSGQITNYLNFVAVDATDRVTRETGLSAFTVYRSRNGSFPVAMTTPLVVELSAANMAGVYALLLDEDMTLASGNDSEELVFHITHAGMAAVTATAELYRNNVTEWNNGLGFTGDIYPSTQTQVGNLATGSAAISVQAESYLLTTGALVSGVLANTETVNGIHHVHTDAAGVLDLYYQFNIGGNGVGTDVSINGRLNSNNDNLIIYAWDWGSSQWDSIGAYAGQASTTNNDRTYSLLVRHTGTGANLGKLRIRFAGTGLTSSELYIDQIYSSFSVVTKSVGYANGNVWIDTLNGTSGTESFVNGTADNPVLTLDEASIIAANIGLSRFSASVGSVITLNQNYSNATANMYGVDINFNGKQLNDTHTYGGHLNGILLGSGDIHFTGAEVENVTIPPLKFRECSFGGTITAGSAGVYSFSNCYSQIAGTGTPIFDFSNVGTVGLNLRSYSGGIEIRNMSATDRMSFEGNGQLIIDASCTGGVISYRGNFKLTDNSGGAVILSQDDNIVTLLAIKEKTDQLTFSKANELDSNIQSINNVEIIGDGSIAPFDVP